MKRKHLLLSALALSVAVFANSVKAADNANATYTGTLSTYYEVAKDQDGTATIGVDGSLSGVTNPQFTVSTNSGSGASGHLTTAQVSSTDTMANVGGTTYVALTNGTPAGANISNALAATPAAANNADVIVYEITVTPSGQSAFAWDGTDSRLEGTVMTAAGSNTVDVALSASARGDTFSTNDTAGSYTLTMTLTAAASV